MVGGSPIDEARIAETIRQAELGTRAEIVCVICRAASTYEFFPLVWAALVAFAAPAPLLAFTLWSAEAIYLTQLLVFLVALAVLSVPVVRMRLVPRTLKRRRAHRAAAEQFLVRGLSRKRDRTGVLVFVAEAERYARIIADEGVATRIDAAHWREAVETLVAHAREGRVTDGCCAAVALCAPVLAQALPPVAATPADELSNRVVVI